MLNRLLASSPTAPATNAMLLLLRVWFGATIALLHGWTKLANFSTLSARFTDPYGLGPALSLSLSIMAELICASLIVVGLATRPASLILCFNMVTAFVFGHHMKLSGPGNGELAFVYLGVWIALLVGGAGRYSLDRALFGRR
jgi:putative oxidoreductase